MRGSELRATPGPVRARRCGLQPGLEAHQGRRVHRHLDPPVGGGDHDDDVIGIQRHLLALGRLATTRIAQLGAVPRPPRARGQGEDPESLELLAGVAAEPENPPPPCVFRPGAAAESEQNGRAPARTPGTYAHLPSRFLLPTKTHTPSIII